MKKRYLVFYILPNNKYDIVYYGNVETLASINYSGNMDSDYFNRCNYDLHYNENLNLYCYIIDLYLNKIREQSILGQHLKRALRIANIKDILE